MLLLDRLSDDLFVVYQPTVKTTKELWDALNDKHDLEIVGKKKFLVSDLYDFKMVDDQSVLSQVNKLQVLMHKIIANGTNFDESFQVSTIID